LVDAGDAALDVQRLPRRKYLERPHGEVQARVQALRARVLDAIAHVERRGARGAGREGGDAQAQPATPAADGRDGRGPVVELLRDLGVVPRDQLALEPEEGLDREGAIDLDHALLVHERLLPVAVDADDGPVGLLAVEVLGIRPGWRIVGDGREERIRRLRELDRLDGDAGDAEAAAAAAALEREPDEARLGV